ncbi:hypothetical protein KM043_000590 [Ampulex compressa]|nr:hypothetical protein KM043_000590 [Ampulex compressa]
MAWRRGGALSASKAGVGGHVGRRRLDSEWIPSIFPLGTKRSSNVGGRGAELESRERDGGYRARLGAGLSSFPSETRHPVAAIGVQTVRRKVARFFASWGDTDIGDDEAKTRRVLRIWRRKEGRPSRQDYFTPHPRLFWSSAIAAYLGA